MSDHESAEPDNSVEIKDDLVLIVQKGDQTYDSVMDLTEEVQELTKGRKNLKLLVDHTQIGKSDAGSRLAGVRTARELSVSRMAIVGAPNHAQVVIKFILRIAGPVLKDWRFFSNIDEARSWLMDKPRTNNETT